MLYELDGRRVLPVRVLAVMIAFGNYAAASLGIYLTIYSYERGYGQLALDNYVLVSLRSFLCLARYPDVLLLVRVTPQRL